MTWQFAIARYVKWLRMSDKSPNTIVQYKHYLNLAADRLGTDSPWAVGAEELEDLMGSVAWGSSARKSLRTTLAGFYRWGHRRGYIADDPTVELPTPRVKPGIARPMPEPLIDAALARADEREVLMIELARNHGLRCGEISRVASWDLDEDDVLTVHGKGSKDRRVPLRQSRDLITAIRAADGWLFPNTQRGGHITPNHVSHLLSRLFPDGWTGHKLRHAFATESYRGCRDMESVSRLLGHISTEITRQYVAVDDDELGEAVDAARKEMRPPHRQDQDGTTAAAA